MPSVSIARLCRILVGSALILGPHLTQCEGHSSRRLPLAGIFGFGESNKRDENGDGQSVPAFSDKSIGVRPPPPRRPPVPVMGQGFGRSAVASLAANTRDTDPRRLPLRPPPPPQNSAVNQGPSRKEGSTGPNSSESAEKSMESTRDNTKMPMDDLSAATQMPPGEKQKNPPPPPPPPQFWVGSKQGSTWGAPPPSEQYGGWQGSYHSDSSTGDQVYYQSELDESLAREYEMISQLDNLTGTIIVMEQREELHLRQLDVLTERIMDVEAQAAGDRNLLVEYDANCTALAMTIEIMQGDLDEWQQRCNELNERQERDQEMLDDLKRRIKEKEAEGEELAIAIENVRLAERRREAGQARRSRGGLFSWIASFFVSTKDSYAEMSREEAYEMAKSTLLRALQSERSNVHELEAVVLSLQQNNSAIAEMVESRDSIIDELNNRIAVFEEDKVVLKAALRQLQKEIKEEAPKAEKLMNDLASSEKEIKRLTSEMNGVIQTHQEEVLALQRTISSKQNAISETESNLTAIGTYVDKLEERLTSFAITRRDMEERERICKGIEEAAINAENGKKILEEKVEEFTKEQEELKKLLEELAAERTSLQKENRKLYTEREFRMDEQEQLQGKHDSLVNETNVLSEQLFEWRSKYESLAPELEIAQRTCVNLEEQLNTAMKMEGELESTRLQAAGLDEELEKVRAEMNKLKEENASLREHEKNQTAQLESFRIKERETELRSRQESELNDTPVKRKVPFREFRKKLSKATGIHGFLTPSSRVEAKLQRNMRSPPFRSGSPTAPSIPKNLEKIPTPPPLPSEASASDLLY